MTAIDPVSPERAKPDFGANSWLVDEMYAQYLADPDSVSESWREFFSDYRGGAPLTFGGNRSDQQPSGIAQRRTRPPRRLSALQRLRRRFPAASPAVRPAPAAPTAPTTPIVGDDVGEPIRGAGAAIAANMERSLACPTATSFRNVPAKLLEVNRKVINGYRSRSGQGKVSFTHLIGYAIVRAIADAVPNDEQHVRRRRRRQAAARPQRARQHGPRRRRRQGRRHPHARRARAARRRHARLRRVPRRLRGADPQGQGATS